MYNCEFNDISKRNTAINTNPINLIIVLYYAFS